jgi:beta-lactamase superfamily II metal-dependent hydrolase
MRFVVLLLLAGSLLFAKKRPNHPNQLTVYLVDVEGGQATFIVTPERESVLIDAGWAGNEGRDAERIATVAKLAKVDKIDYLVLTNYQPDHAGGVAQLVQKLPVGTFIDRGPGHDAGAQQQVVRQYEAAIGSSQRLMAKPGKDLPLRSVDATVVTANGGTIAHALPTGGNLNTYCEATPDRRSGDAEDARTLGTFWHFGRFHMLDLSDLPWEKEKQLMCPTNRLGKVDLLLVSHHGSDESSSPALIHDITPRVAIVENGSGRGGSSSTYNRLKTVSGLEDIWQLHYSEDGGKNHNAVETKIANLGEDDGFYLKITANEDGSFEVFNPRNKFSQQYASKGSFGRLGWETR